MAKEEPPKDYLTEHHKRHAIAQTIIHGHKRRTNKAFEYAVEKHLLNKYGNPDFTKMEDEDLQEAFSDSMMDYLEKDIKQIVDVKDPFYTI